jgi:SAM-dependent methyltransferase
MHPYTEKLANYIIKAIDKFQKIPTMVKMILFILIVFLMILYSKQMASQEGLEGPQGFLEGFAQQNQFLFKTGPEVYDQFYANIYDYLVFNGLKDDYEVGEIINATSPTMQTKILDVGCGTGHHVAKFEEQKLHTIGIDISESMIEQAKENYPSYTFKVADALDKNAVVGGVYTHVTCLYFTLYYFQDKTLFFQNAIYWLQPGGYLIIHLVNRDKFDPILPPGNPLSFVSPQKYAKTRITHTNLVFNNFDYKANFDLNKDTDVAKFSERFKYKDGKSRKNEHVMYMESQESILREATDVGFILETKIDLKQCAYDYQYLYVLRKPE